MQRRSWVEQYMRETERARRKAILDEALQEEGMSPENELRQKLFEARYSRSENPEVDYFIRGWMQMFYLGGAAHGLFAKRRIEKDAAAVLHDWRFDLAEQYGEIGRTVLYEELYNMAALYISLCRNDRNYSAILLGLGRMKDENLVGKIAHDVYTTAVETPRAINKAEEFKLFTEAAVAAFCDLYPEKKEAFLKRINE